MFSYVAQVGATLGVCGKGRGDSAADPTLKEGSRVLEIRCHGEVSWFLAIDFINQEFDKCWRRGLEGGSPFPS